MARRMRQAHGRVVVEQHLLDGRVVQHLLARRRRAVFDGLDQGLGQAVRLVEMLQAVVVGVAFGDADQAVGHRRAQQAQHAQDHRQDRQAGRIGQALDRVAAHQGADRREQAVDQEEGDDRQQAHHAGDPQRVVVGVVAHLVADHAAHLGQVRALLEHGVAHRHPRRAEQARDVGGIGVGLLGAVVDEDLVGRDAVGLGHGHDLVAHRAGRRGRVLVEDRLDIDRGQHHHHGDEHRRQPAAPQPPGARRLADQGVQRRQEQAEQHRADRRADRRLAQPAGEGLAGQAVLPSAATSRHRPTRAGSARCRPAGRRRRPPG
jgi:hypothetical protein